MREEDMRSDDVPVRDRQEDAVERAVLARSSSRLWGFLAAFFCRLPDERFVRGLAEGPLAGTLDALAQSVGFSDETREGAALMSRFARERCGDDAAELRTKIGVERTRLMRGVKPGYGPLPPYESVYANPAREVDLDAVAAVARTYAQAGAALPADNREQPDYLGLELDFMRHVRAVEADRWEAGDAGAAQDARVQGDAFVANHLAPWVGAYCEAMLADAQLDLYRGLAMLTSGFVADEARAAQERCGSMAAA